MSQCGSCFVGQCKRHPLQDHGKRENDIKSRVSNQSQTMKKIYDTIKVKVDKQLREDCAAINQTEYRLLQEQERLTAEKRGSKWTEKQQQRVKNLRLGGHMIGYMIESSDEEKNRKRKKPEKTNEKKKKKKEKKDKKAAKERKKSKVKYNKIGHQSDTDTSETGGIDRKHAETNEKEEIIGDLKQSTGRKHSDVQI